MAMLKVHLSVFAKIYFVTGFGPEEIVYPRLEHLITLRPLSIWLRQLLLRNLLERLRVRADVQPVPIPSTHLIYIVIFPSLSLTNIVLNCKQPEMQERQVIIIIMCKLAVRKWKRSSTPHTQVRHYVNGRGHLLLIHK